MKENIMEREYEAWNRHFEALCQRFAVSIQERVRWI